MKDYTFNKSLLFGDHVETIKKIDVSNEAGVCEVTIEFKDPAMDTIEFKVIEGLDNQFPDIMASQLARLLTLETRYQDYRTREDRLYATILNDVVLEMPNATKAKCIKEINLRMRKAMLELNKHSFPAMVAVFEKAKTDLVGKAVLCTGKISKKGNPYMAISPLRG